MEVLEITLTGRSGLTDNTVHIKGGSVISSNPNCMSMRTEVMNLKGSPFTFSYSNNFFVSFGCNIIATIKETDEEFVGCKSRCNTSFINKARNSGPSFNHYTSSIPFGLQAFNVDFVSTNNKVLEGCNYAFLLDNSWPDILESNKIVEKLGFIPVVLDWQIYNWTNGWCEMLDSFNNRQDFQCDFDTSSFGSYKDDAKFLYNTISNHYDKIA